MEPKSGKFTLLDLAGGGAAGETRALRGIPFHLQPEIAFVPGFALEVPLRGRAGFLCLASYADPDPHETTAGGVDDIEKLGQPLAEMLLEWEDGDQTVFPIRRRFETNARTFPWGHWAFHALTHAQLVPSHLHDPLPDAAGWGLLQTNVKHSAPAPYLWISALANPRPESELKAVRFRACGEDRWVLCGLTLFHGAGHPLRYEPLRLHRLELPEAHGEDAARWQVEVDLGVVARVHPPLQFASQAWLAAPDQGIGSQARIDAAARHLDAEITASTEAAITLRDARTGAVQPVSVRILERDKVWLHGQVVDPSTGRPTPVRLAFRSVDGRYIPPYGHRTEVNDGWFQDYGADVKLMDSPFAYVDGTFQVELPIGDVLVEMTKGFEHEAVRRRLTITPDQRELTLEIPRHTDLRHRGWVTADTHVHFISPTTALLEAQAEGLNLVNLLAAQWGEMYNNIGDLAHGSIGSADGESLVRMGTENRSHLLGHISLLGGRGGPVFPLSGSFPTGHDEAWFGEPLRQTMADWADECRRRDGLVVAPHFPYPTAEVAADIVLGKIDAIELFPYGYSALGLLDWYRYLNCGYRLPAVGGTDKMGAYMPVGANRTYAYIGEEEFSFDAWARAVRRGNTFTTSGPLLLFQVDGRAPGDEIVLAGGAGTIEFAIEASSFIPFHRVDVVSGGRIVWSHEEVGGTRRFSLRDTLRVEAPGWLAARCSSRHGPTTSWNLHIAAHTSPIYLSTPGRELFSAPVATYLLTLIAGTRLWAESLATRADPERQEHIRRTLDEACARLKQRHRQAS